MTDNLSTQSALHRFQLAAGEVVAALSDIAKTPPDLKAYLEAHAAVLVRILELKGVAYDLAQGAGLQTIYTSGLKELNLGHEQVMAFRKAIQKVASDGKPLVLAPNTLPAEALRAASGGDVPAVHELPIFNQTPFVQFFIPIPLNNRVIGVMQAWLLPESSDLVPILGEVLGRSCAAMELYFKARQVEEVTGELARLHGYGEFLETLAGDLDLDGVAKALLAYTLSASAAGRVTLLLAKDYRETLIRLDEGVLQFHYRCYGSLGAQAPEPTSQEAHTLEAIGLYLLEKSRQRGLEAMPAAVVPPPAAGKLEAPKAFPPALLPTPPGKRPQVSFQWIKRGEGEDLPEPVEHYLALSPMNWATCLPLVDTQQRIVGILLLEGKDSTEKTAEALPKLQGLIYSGGHALATALFWHDRRTLRWARKWINWKDGTLDTPKKRRLAYIGGPLAALLAVMCYPMEYNIKAHAQVRPRTVMQLSAQVSGRILAVNTQEGSRVKKDELLVEIDTQRLQYEKRRIESDYLQALAEADLALGAGDEPGMQAAIFKADKAEAQIEGLAYQIDQGSVRAPFAGIVLGPQNMAQKVGQVASMGEPLIEIARPNDWEVKIQLYEQDVVYLEERLQDKQAIDATLKLTADPNQKYELQLKDPADLAHGLEPKPEDYFFIAVLPLGEEPNTEELLKAGFSGRVAFHVGRRPVAYVLLKDFVRYLRVRWL